VKVWGEIIRAGLDRDFRGNDKKGTGCPKEKRLKKEGCAQKDESDCQG